MRIRVMITRAVSPIAIAHPAVVIIIPFVIPPGARTAGSYIPGVLRRVNAAKKD
jgi:hypothetical protein